MKSEKPPKDVAEKKGTEPARSGFGSYLSDAITKSLVGNNEPPPSAPEGDLKSALQRYRLPREVERLKREVAALKRSKAASRKCPLYSYVAAVKKANHDKASDHEFITRRVDVVLEKERKELADICPKTWNKIPDLPRLLSEARRHRRLKKAVARFISKVQVS